MPQCELPRPFPTWRTLAALTAAGAIVGTAAVGMWVHLFDSQPLDAAFGALMAVWVWLVFAAGVPVFAAFAAGGLLPAVKAHFGLVGVRLATSLALAAAMVKLGQAGAEVVLLTLVSVYLPLLAIESVFVGRHLLRSGTAPSPSSHKVLS